jgi:hypothetical protein
MNHLHGVSFWDGNTGTAVGYNGTILRTTDGGATWASQVSGTTNDLWGVSLPKADTGTAVGYDGIILRTTDGGSTWFKQTSSAWAVLYKVLFTDANTGTAVGEGGAIFRTTNGGSNWIWQPSGIWYHLRGVSFTDANTGTVVGLNGTILRTTTGGAGVETPSVESSGWGKRGPTREVKATPNPFFSYAVVPGSEREEFALYDLSGRLVGTYRGDRLGEDLKAGVYFARGLGEGSPVFRVVKIR